MWWKKTKPHDTVRESALAEWKTCKNLSGIPLFTTSSKERGVVQHFDYVTMWLSLVVRSGLGTTACCFLGHASLLEYAGVEEKTAGEGGERADGGAGGRHNFTSEHQAHSAGPEGPDEPSQQSGTTTVFFLLKSAPIVSPFVAYTYFRGSDTEVWWKVLLLSTLDELHEELLDEANLSYGTHKPTDQIQNSMGQPSGGLHHSEGSRPLPHQAGKRLPPPGFKNTLMTQRWTQNAGTLTTTQTGKRKKRLKWWSAPNWNKSCHRCFRGVVNTLYGAVTLASCIFYSVFYSIFKGFLGYFPDFLSHL